MLLLFIETYADVKRRGVGRNVHVNLDHTRRWNLDNFDWQWVGTRELGDSVQVAVVRREGVASRWDESHEVTAGKRTVILHGGLGLTQIKFC